MTVNSLALCRIIYHLLNQTSWPHAVNQHMCNGYVGTLPGGLCRATGYTAIPIAIISRSHFIQKMLSMTVISCFRSSNLWAILDRYILFHYSCILLQNAHPEFNYAKLCQTFLILSVLTFNSLNNYLKHNSFCANPKSMQTQNQVKPLKKKTSCNYDSKYGNLLARKTCMGSKRTPSSLDGVDSARLLLWPSHFYII